MNALLPRGKPLFEPSFTIGNIITIITFLVGGLIGYVRLSDKVDLIAAQLYEHKVQQTKTEDSYVRRDVQETRNRFIDQQLSEMNSKLDTLLKEIKMLR